MLSGIFLSSSFILNYVRPRECILHKYANSRLSPLLRANPIIQGWPDFFVFGPNIYNNFYLGPQILQNFILSKISAKQNFFFFRHFWYAYSEKLWTNLCNAMVIQITKWSKGRKNKLEDLSLAMSNIIKYNLVLSCFEAHYVNLGLLL